MLFKTTDYFNYMKSRSDRSFIKNEWIWYVINNPVHQETQTDGRIRRWAKITEAEGRYLRIILLADGETVHNAFFDRRFKEKTS